MKADHPKNPRVQFAKYAAINLAFFITLTFGGYVTVFLQSIGFNAQQVGLISALNSGAAIFASPFFGFLSDKLRSLKKVLTIALVVGSAFFIVIPFASGFYMAGFSVLFILIPIATFFRMPVMPLLDNWMLLNSRDEKLNYGALRAFGSLSFAVGALALGYIVPMVGVDSIFFASAVVTVPAILMITFIRGSADNGAGQKKLSFKEMQIGQLFKNYYLVTYIIFSIFQRIPFQGSMIFLPFLIDDIGGNVAQMGIIMGLRALAEIPTMMLLKPLRQKYPLYILIIAATTLFIAESFLHSVATSFNTLIVISLVHGVGNGIILTAGSSYVFSLAPEHLKATTQTVLSSMAAVAGIIGGLLGGLLIALFSIQQFYLFIGIMLAVALVLFVASFFVGEKLLGLKRPGLSLN